MQATEPWFEGFKAKCRVLAPSHLAEGDTCRLACICRCTSKRHTHYMVVQLVKFIKHQQDREAAPTTATVIDHYDSAEASNIPVVDNTTIDMERMVWDTPCLEYEMQGSKRYNTWFANGQGQNYFTCKCHWLRAHPWCKYCVKIKEAAGEHSKHFEL